MQNCTVLGLDNSTYCTGWSIVKYEDDKYTLITYGTINRDKDLKNILVKFEKDLIHIIKKYKPDYISAEQMFVGNNHITSIHLAYIHGIMLLVAEKLKIPVTYYAPMTLKSQILGKVKRKVDDKIKTGEEMKQEVHDYIINFFGKDSFKKEYTLDVTDSISAALVFIKNDGKEILTGKKLKRFLKMEEERKAKEARRLEREKKRLEKERIKEEKRKEREALKKKREEMKAAKEKEKKRAAELRKKAKKGN